MSSPACIKTYYAIMNRCGGILYTAFGNAINIILFRFYDRAARAVRIVWILNEDLLYTR